MPNVRHLSHRFAVAAVLGAWLALVGPAGAAGFDAETFTLANGLEVVVIANRRAPVIANMVWYRVGAADEEPGESGLAHFLEHLMFKGTRDVPPGEFSKIVAHNGGNDNAFTGHDYTAYFQRVARDRLDLVLKLEADRMTGLVLTDKEVLPERKVVLEERRSRTENDPGALLEEQVMAALYLNSPYRRPVIGWAEEIARLGRDEAIDFYRRHYAPNNAILVVVGDVSADELRPLAEKYFGTIAAVPVPPRMRPPEPRPRAARRVILTDARVRLAELTRDYLAPSYGAGKREHAYALEILSEILGGGPTSRLYREIAIEKKLAAMALANYSPTAIDRVSFSIHLSPRPGVKVEKLETALDGVLGDLSTRGVNADEVASAKKRLRASVTYAQDSIFAVANIFGAALATGQTVADVEAWPERIDAVTVAQVNEAARALFVPENSVTGVLLPASAPAGGRESEREGGPERGPGNRQGAIR